MQHPNSEHKPPTIGLLRALSGLLPACLGLLTAVPIGDACLEHPRSHDALECRGFARMAIPAASCRAAEPPEELGYLPKAYIDTMVMRAFYGLNEATAYEGFKNRREKSIEEAKHIAHKLRKAAEHDPNKRYILWKVSELENQIILEENEMLEKKKRERLVVTNHLVDAFNVETTRKRPDFATLHNIQSQMERVDPGKASEIGWLIKDRASSLGQVVMHNARTALQNGNISAARSELDYITRNLNYLNISLGSYGQLTGALQSRLDVNREEEYTRKELGKAEQLYRDGRLGSAGELLERAGTRLAVMKSAMQPRPWSHLESRRRKLLADVEQVEDSLVRANLAVLRHRGIDPAVSYMNRVLKPREVSRTKTAIVNTRIIQALLRKKHEEEARDTVISPELLSLTKSSGDRSLGMDAIKDKARRVAKARADSIRAVREKEERKERKRLEAQRKRRERREARKARRLARKKRREQKKLARQQRKREEQLAKERMKERERRKREEEARRRKEREMRRQQQLAEQRRMREERLAKERMRERERGKREEEARQRRAQQQRKQQRLAEQRRMREEAEERMKKREQEKRDDEARSVSVERGAPRPTQQQPQPVLAARTPTQPTEAPMQSLEEASRDLRRENERNKEEAKDDLVEIYTLLEKDMIRRAYNKFTAREAFLREHLHPEAFHVLKQTVVKTFEYLVNNSPRR